jgi:hypothetical protein
LKKLLLPFHPMTGKNCFLGILSPLNLTDTPQAGFVGFAPATFFCARKNASHFSLSGAKKRRKLLRVMRHIWLWFIKRLTKYYK